MDAATGAVKWRWTGDGPAYASPILATIGGMRQIITQSQNKLVGVAAADGKLLWEVPIKTPYEQNSVTPLVVNDVVDLPPASKIRRSPTRIHADPGKGWQATPRWRNEQVSMYMSSPAVSGSAIFGLSNKNRGQFFAIDAASGKTLWLGKGREAENASIVRAGEYSAAGDHEQRADRREAERDRVRRSETLHDRRFGDVGASRIRRADTSSSRTSTS